MTWHSDASLPRGCAEGGGDGVVWRTVARRVGGAGVVLGGGAEMPSRVTRRLAGRCATRSDRLHLVANNTRFLTSCARFPDLEVPGARAVRTPSGAGLAGTLSSSVVRCWRPSWTRRTARGHGLPWRKLDRGRRDARLPPCPGRVKGSVDAEDRVFGRALTRDGRRVQGTAPPWSPDTVMGRPRNSAECCSDDGQRAR